MGSRQSTALRMQGSCSRRIGVASMAFIRGRTVETSRRKPSIHRGSHSWKCSARQRTAHQCWPRCKSFTAHGKSSATGRKRSRCNCFRLQWTAIFSGGRGGGLAGAPWSQHRLRALGGAGAEPSRGGRHGHTASCRHGAQCTGETLPRRRRGGSAHAQHEWEGARGSVGPSGHLERHGISVRRHGLSMHVVVEGPCLLQEDVLCRSASCSPSTFSYICRPAVHLCVLLQVRRLRACRIHKDAQAALALCHIVSRAASSAAPTWAEARPDVDGSWRGQGKARERPWLTPRPSGEVSRGAAYDRECRGKRTTGGQLSASPRHACEWHVAPGPCRASLTHSSALSVVSVGQPVFAQRKPRVTHSSSLPLSLPLSPVPLLLHSPLGEAQTTSGFETSLGTTGLNIALLECHLEPAQPGLTQFWEQQALMQCPA